MFARILTHYYILLRRWVVLVKLAAVAEIVQEDKHPQYPIPGIILKLTSLYLDLDVFSLSERGGGGGAGGGGASASTAATDDAAPLFYSPGKRGYYSPRQGRATPERINAFRNVGRCDVLIINWTSQFILTN